MLDVQQTQVYITKNLDFGKKKTKNLDDDIDSKEKVLKNNSTSLNIQNQK
jgi:hypothetical protein